MISPIVVTATPGIYEREALIQDNVLRNKTYLQGYDSMKDYSQVFQINRT